MKNLRLATVTAVLPFVTLFLAGCWTPPNANVQPQGDPRLIQTGFPCVFRQDPAPVESVNASQRTLTLKRTDGLMQIYKVDPAVKEFDQVKAGDQLKVTGNDVFTVYVLKNGQLPGPDGKFETIDVNAKVLLVDPSYRILTLQYPNGRSEQFKASLDAKLQEMAPGDDVVVQPNDVTEIKIEKP